MIIERGGIDLPRSGNAEILQITSPDTSGAIQELLELLDHKAQVWKWQVELCLRGGTKGLGLHAYLARVDGRAVATVLLLHSRPFGIVTHVFTREAYRRQGLSTALLGMAVLDFDDFPGSLMMLSAPLEGTAVRLYESFSFSFFCPEQSCGGMIRLGAGSTVDDILQGPGTGIKEASWRHYLAMCALYSAPGPVQLRSIHLESVGPRLVERSFVDLKLRQTQGSEIKSWVIEGSSSTVLGATVLGPHPWWRDHGRRLLDFYVHPEGRNMAEDLLDSAIADTAGKIECLMDSQAAVEIDLLKQRGFAEIGIPGELLFPGRTVDLTLMRQV